MTATFDRWVRMMVDWISVADFDCRRPQRNGEHEEWSEMWPLREEPDE